MKKILYNTLMCSLFLLALLLTQSKTALGIDSNSKSIYAVPLNVNGKIIYQNVIQQNEKDINDNFNTLAATTNGSITFTLHDPEHIQYVNDVSLFNKVNITGTNNYFYANYGTLNRTLEQTEDGWKININNLVWNEGSTGYFFIQTSKYIYKVFIAQQQIGTTIPLSADDTYIAVNANIKYADIGLQIQGIQANYRDENGVYIGGFLIQNQMIQSGKYDFIIMANDVKNSYYLTKIDFQLTKEYNILDFERQDAGIVTLNLNSSSAYNMKPSNFVGFRGDYRIYWYTKIPYNINTVYVSKMNYNSCGIAAKNDGWDYFYDTPNQFNITDDSTVMNFGTDFKAVLIDDAYEYKKDQNCYNLGIKDQYNNILTNLLVLNGTKPTGKVEITDSIGTKTIVDINDIANPWFQLPGTVGKYHISYNVTGGQFPVEPLLSTEIDVTDSSIIIIFEPSSFTLKTTYVSGNEVDLLWENYSRVGGPNIFNIYRAQSSDGPYTFIGSSTTNTFTDRSVLPSSSYWYYVKNEETIPFRYEKETTNTVSVTTNSYLTPDNTIAISIQDANHELYINPFEIQSVYRSYYIGGNYQYINSYEIKPQIEKNQGGWVIRYRNIDWSKANEYTIFVKTSKYLFKAAIDQSKIGTNISLNIDDSIVPIQVNIPFATGSSHIDKIQVNYLDDNGFPMVAGYVVPGMSIAAGRCNFQVIGTDSKYGFYLTKKDQNISKDNNTLNFDRAEVSLVKINFNNLNNIASKLRSFYPIDSTIDYSIGYDLSLNNSTIIILDPYGPLVYDSLYVSKLNYREIHIGFSTDNGINLEYSTSQPLNAQDDTYTINYDTNFKCNINLEKQKYTPGEHLFANDFFITDGFNNRLRYMLGSSMNSIVGTIEFIDSNGNTVHTVSNGSLGAFSPSFELPNITGTYTMKYSISGTPYAIAPGTTLITIGNSAQVQKDALNNSIIAAEALLTGKTVGTQAGNVPQSAKDAFQAAIDTAKGVRDNPNATQEEVDAQITALAAATTAFNNSVINSSNTVKCGDVNGDGTVDLNDSLEIMYYKSHMSSKMSDNAKVNILILNIADVNGDGAVDLSDSLEIKYYKAHMNSSMSAETLRRINTVIP